MPFVERDHLVIDDEIRFIVSLHVQVQRRDFFASPVDRLEGWLFLFTVFAFGGRFAY